MTEGAGRLDIGAMLDGARLVVVGGTGFLGKVWLSMLLCRYPGIGQIYLVVRARGAQDSESRFWADIASSEPFSPLRALHPGAEFEEFLKSKVTALDADVSRPLCGFLPDTLRAITGTIDALVNVAGVVDFNPPLDEAVLTNAKGVQNLVALATALGDVPILHTSTCYVAGYREGRVFEVDPRDDPFPRYKDMPGAPFDPVREITEGLELARSIARHADDAHRIARFEDEARKNLEGRKEPTRGPAYDAELKKVKQRFVHDETERVGMERARFWGWPNTYTYTKALGELVLAASGLQFTIVRPSVIESSLLFPFPGWNEGINTMAPIMYMFMQGHMQIPASDRTSLDVIPVDAVCGGMILALATLLEGTHKPVYQLGTSDSNAVPMNRLIELCGLYKRRHYQRTGKGNPWTNFIQAHWEPTPVTESEFLSQGAPAIARHAKTLSQLARQGAVGPLAGVLGPASRALASYAEVAKRNGEIFTLFLPFMAQTEYRFVTRNMYEARARLSPEDRAAIVCEPDTLDWRHYILDVHCPGLDRWVMPQIDAKVKRETRPLKSYETLVDLLDEAAERHEHRAAILRMESEGIARVTFADWAARAGAVASRLAESGVRPGDRVALAAGNHPDWPIAYFGILKAGAVALPLDAALESGPLGNVLAASRAVAVIVDEKVSARLDALGHVTAARHDVHAVTAADPARRAPTVPKPKRDGLASVIYTSGTTGTPKGVSLTHGNFTSLIAALAPVFPLGQGDRVLSVLPLHHTFEFTCGMLLPLSRGASVVYLDELSGDRVTQAMREAKVTAMVGVPALWQLLERRITQQVRERGAAVSAVFDWALALNRMLGQRVGADLGRVLFGPVHLALGGNLKYLISGGAALPGDTAKIFQGLGLPLSEGYGLTEAAPVLTVAKASTGMKPGSVGKPIPGVEVMIDRPDASGVGEVLARGPNVMQGYADDPESTAKVITEDGWLRTGDLGSIDKRGRLTIVGRSKEVIVSASGENLYPDDVERALGDIDGVKELVVLGVTDPRGGERAAMLVVPDTEGLSDDERVTARERVMRSVRHKVRELPPAWQPAVVLAYDAELPRTATRKVKRAEVRAIAERLATATSPARRAEAPAGSTPVRTAVAAIARRPVGEITATTKLRADLGFDSLMAMELAVSLEAVTGSRLPEANLAAYETVADLEDALHVRAEADAAKPAKRGHRDDDDDAPRAVALPEPVRDGVKGVLSVIQREFYGQVMKPRVTGRAFIPHNRSTLVVANHSSHLDMGFVKYALGAYGDDLVALAARDYFFDTSLKRTLAENFTNLAAFDRDAGLHQTLREAGDLLEAGKTVLIFPEGTRSPDGSLQKFKGAVGFLALHHGVDILPLHLGGTYEALPKSRWLPQRRDITARIGPPLEIAELRRLTHGMKPAHAAKAVAKLAQRAVESLRDGGVLDLSTLDSADEETARKHPLVELFDELPRRFLPGRIDNPVSFYFTLGNEPESKWTVQVSPESCRVVQGKVDGAQADCVLKTTPEIFTRIVREAYEPGVTEFMAGLVKSNDVGLLQTFTRAFQLG